MDYISELRKKYPACTLNSENDIEWQDLDLIYNYLMNNREYLFEPVDILKIYNLFEQFHFQDARIATMKYHLQHLKHLDNLEKFNVGQAQFLLTNDLEEYEHYVEAYSNTNYIIPLRIFYKKDSAYDQGAFIVCWNELPICVGARKHMEIVGWEHLFILTEEYMALMPTAGENYSKNFLLFVILSMLQTDEYRGYHGCKFNVINSTTIEKFFEAMARYVCSLQSYRRGNITLQDAINEASNYLPTSESIDSSILNTISAVLIKSNIHQLLDKKKRLMKCHGVSCYIGFLNVNYS